MTCHIPAEIVAGQKVHDFHPRAIDLLEPVKRDIRAYLPATGIRAGLLGVRSPQARAAPAGLLRPATVGDVETV